jgi:ABC-2 type transport system ATP-binding protein
VTLAIQTAHLNKTFPNHTAVTDLSLKVARGEVFGFLGPNGAGKTTTIKMLLGLCRPSSGTASVLGGSIQDLEVRRKLGFLPELFRFHEWLSAEEFLRFHGQLYGMTRSDLERRIPEVLALVGLTGRGRDKLRTYSKGMQQRAGLAQAILNRPELVFLDEPTSALDPLGRREVREIIARLKLEGMTVFLNSHLLSEVEQSCDRVAIVNRGTVLRSGPLQELLSTLELEVGVDRVTSELSANLAPFGRVLETSETMIRLELKFESDVPIIARTVIESGCELRALVPKHQDLEELFMDVIEGQIEGQSPESTAAEARA